MRNQDSLIELLEIRRFLERHGAAASPWSRPQAQTARLLTLLREHSRDEAFWRDVKVLLARLENNRYQPAKPGRVSALKPAEIDDVVDALRASVRRRGAGSVRDWATHVGTASALLGFAWLCLADAQAFDTGSERQGPPVRPAAIAYPIANTPTQAPEPAILAATLDGEFAFEADDTDLAEIVRVADIPISSKRDLAIALPELDGAYRAALLDLFETMSDEDIAVILVTMSESPNIRAGAATALGEDDESPMDQDAVDQAGDPFKGLRRACGCGDDDDDDNDDDH